MNQLPQTDCVIKGAAHFKAVRSCPPHHFNEDFQMSNATLTASRFVRVLAVAHAALTTEEAKAFYSEVGALALEVGSWVLHGFFVALSWAVWACDIALGWAVVELPRFWQDARSAIRSAVASAQGGPVALPWSADGFSPEFLAQASEGLEIEWPKPNPDACWVTGMLPMA